MLWTEKEEQGLIEGVQEFGVGHWMQIRRSKLREWDEVEIRLKCARLMGRQDLSSYQDWKGDAAQMAQERANNKAKADAGDGVWICGFLTTENLVPQQYLTNLSKVLLPKVTEWQLSEKVKALETRIVVQFVTVICVYKNKYKKNENEQFQFQFIL